MTSPAMEPRELTAGRELDALVDEKVFGRDVAWWAKPTREPYFKGISDGYFTQTTVPRRSTDLLAAWAVVEKMRSLGWVFELDNLSGASAAFWRLGNQGARLYREYKSADTAPLAICLAALKAVAA